MVLNPGRARKMLAAIRLFNGTAGLLVPEFLLQRLGADRETGRSGVYPFRMFGIRTMLIGADLLLLLGGAPPPCPGGGGRAPPGPPDSPS